jgi:hypothetical protein
MTKAEIRACEEISWTDSSGFLFEGKEAETARTQRYERLFADAAIGQKDKEDVLPCPANIIKRAPCLFRPKFHYSY